MSIDPKPIRPLHIVKCTGSRRGSGGSWESASGSPENDSPLKIPKRRIETPPDTFVLAPRIAVTPQFSTLDDGVVTFWAAVQLSTQFCRPITPDRIWREGWVRHLKTGPSQLDVFQYGCLFDCKLEILATSHSTILEILDDKPVSPVSHGITLYPGSHILKLARIRLAPTERRCSLPVSPTTLRGHSGGGHLRSNSDELIEDLEFQLGSTTTEFLVVRLTYRHSGLPQDKDNSGGSSSSTTPRDGRTVPGMTRMHTTSTTWATALVKRHHAASPWSLPPRPTAGPPHGHIYPQLRQQQHLKPLLDLVAKH